MSPEPPLNFNSGRGNPRTWIAYFRGWSRFQKTPKVGVRRAIGATTGHMMRGILREGLTLAMVGCAVGLAAGALGA